MKIKTWIEQREIPGTLADLARRILDGEQVYMDTEKTLRALCSLEAAVREGGNQRAAARRLGLCKQTVLRDMRMLGINAETLRKLADRVEHGNNSKTEEVCGG